MIPFPKEVAEQYPRVLICAPTYEGKDYCFEEWLFNVGRFTYPRNRVGLFLADNSKTDKYALKLAKEYGIKTHWRDYGNASAYERLAYGHEECRLYAIKHGFDYMLHLETDVFPQPNVIEQLLLCRQHMVSALYSIGGGASRLPLPIYIDEGAPFGGNFQPALTTTTEELAHFVKGSGLKKVVNAGLGCALIHRDIFEVVPFRFEKDSQGAPDTHFALDLMARRIPVYVNLDTHAYHWQESTWGKHVQHMGYFKNQ